jgi:hypothetical protein
VFRTAGSGLDPAENGTAYLWGQSGGQVGKGATPAPWDDGMAWTAIIPAAASASQSERVSFFMLILLEFGISQPRNEAYDL